MVRLSKVAGTERELARLEADPWAYLGDNVADDLERRIRRMGVLEQRRATQGRPPIRGERLLNRILSRPGKHLGVARHADNAALRGFATMVVRDTASHEVQWDKSSLNANVVCKGGRQKLWDAVINGTVEKVTLLRVGSSGAAVNENDTGMNTPLSPSLTLTSLTRTEQTLSAQAFMDATQHNGSTIREAGLAFSDFTLLNHFLVSPEIEKDSSKTVTGTALITSNAT